MSPENEKTGEVSVEVKDAPVPVEVKPYIEPYPVDIYLKSGAVIHLPQMTKFVARSKGNALISLSWEHFDDHRLVFIDMSHVAAIVTESGSVALGTPVVGRL